MFEKFNLIRYSLTHDGKKLTDYILTDLTTRTRLRADESIMIKFKLEPGEMPEDVSYTVYGTPYYHWTIMMANNIFDVHNEWFMANEQLIDHCIAKYNLSCEVAPANISAAQNTFYTSHKLKPNDVVTLQSDDMPGGLYENTKYYAFNTTDASFQLTATLESTTPINITSVGSASVKVTCDKLDVPAYWIDEQDNVVSTAFDLYEGWSNNEDTNTTYKNKMNEIISGGVSRSSYVSAINKDVTDLGNDVLDVVVTHTPQDQINPPQYRVLTNYQYEEMMNTRKQYVYIIRPEYIKMFVDKFNEAVAQ